jgi:hypothetical protein
MDGGHLTPWRFDLRPARLRIGRPESAGRDLANTCRAGNSIGWPHPLAHYALYPTQFDTRPAFGA